MKPRKPSSTGGLIEAPDHLPRCCGRREIVASNDLAGNIDRTALEPSAPSWPASRKHAGASKRKAW
jgi:hypothetical protein